MYLFLSKRHPGPWQWETVKKYMEEGTVLTLKVGGIVNKGVIVYVEGLRGFIPASHQAIGYVEDTNPYLGKTVEAKVITADEEKNRLVLSVKEVLYDRRREEKEERSTPSSQAPY